MNRREWRDQVIEPALEPELPIIDAHHHLWASAPADPYEPFPPEVLIADKTASGHAIVATVYVDSHSNYHSDGPEHLRVVGETAYVEGVASAAARAGGAAKGICAAIVAHADLLLGAAVGEVLDAHAAASPRFRGIRHMTALDPDLAAIYGAAAPELMMRPAFREGFAQLVKRDLSFDAWMFHPQLPELVDLARAFPDARIVLDHLGGPVGIGRFAGRREETFAGWKANMAAVAACPNVVVKLGALNMTYSTLDATDLPVPRGSAETAAVQRDHVLTAIDLFGPERCMFESNFPVDMLSISYGVLWNTFKRITADLGAAERALLFSGTAARVYGIDFG